MDEMNDKHITTAVRHRFHRALDATPDLTALAVTGVANRLFLQQGQIDRACGVYCLAMALMLGGAMSRRQLYRELTSHESRASVDDILFRGAHAVDLQQLGRRLCSKSSFDVLKGSHSAVLAGTITAVDDGMPVLLAVEDARRVYSHWVLVVGIEHRPEIDDPSALLAIDPNSGRPAPTLQFYNWKLVLGTPRRGARYLKCFDACGKRRSVTCTEALLIH